MKTYTRPPRAGELRTVRRFLWLPLTLRGETRWWEIAEVIQEYRVLPYSAFRPEAGWHDLAWYRGFT